MSKHVIWLALALVFALSAAAWAQEDRLPETGMFHFDLRPLTVAGLSVDSIKLDAEPHDEMTIYNSGSTPGFKFGYLFGGRHDVGFHAYTNDWNEQIVFRPGRESGSEQTTVTNRSYFRFFPYYNYNFHPSTWIMPYVGPLLGFIVGQLHFNDRENHDHDYQTTDFDLVAGAEGGVKLFPYQHIAVDIGTLVAGGPSWRKIKYNDDRADADWNGGVFLFSLYAGLNIYF